VNATEEMLQVRNWCSTVMVSQIFAQVHLGHRFVGQRSLIEICTVSADLFQSVKDFRVKRDNYRF